MAKLVKEFAKWYSSHDEIEKEQKKGAYYDDDHDPSYDPDLGDDFDGYRGGGDEDDDWEDDERELDLDMEFDRKEDPKTPFIDGEEVVYLGNTGNRKYKSGKIRRTRDDGKIVVKFEDNKLVAISKPHLRHKLSTEKIERKKAELEVKKQEKLAKDEARKKEMEEAAKNPNLTATSGKWWEQSKK
jgi:hypothetical protein